VSYSHGLKWTFIGCLPSLANKRHHYLACNLHSNTRYDMTRHHMMHYIHSTADV